MRGSEEWKKRKELSLQGGGEARIERQHASGKLTARERISLLLDPDSFLEIDALVVNTSTPSDAPLYGDGVVTGTGRINGRPVAVFAQDFTVFGGSLASAHARKVCKVMDLAERTGCPIIGLNDSGGARIQEGVESLGGYADIFLRNTQLSGVIPQISFILGPCAGGAVYSPAITDFIVMVDGISHMFITGPDVIRAVTKEEVSKEALGGGVTHSSISGVAHYVAATEAEAFEWCRALLSFIPQNNQDPTPGIYASGDIDLSPQEGLRNLIPDNPGQPYDVREVIRAITDNADLFEIQAEYAKNIVVGFAFVAGQSVGIVANQPAHLAGCLDIAASTKAARFVRFCDAFNIPLLTLVDVPGFLPGVNQEHGGIIRHGAKLLYAFAEATVPKVTVILRKAYGGAYDVMSSKHLRGDFNFAYPSAEIAVMGAEGAVNIIHRSTLESASSEEARGGLRKSLTDEYRAEHLNPWTATELGFVDAVIDPADTRSCLHRAFEFLRGKKLSVPRRKHGNIPL